MDKDKSEKDKLDPFTKCDKIQPLFRLLTSLMPYTRYAAYVKTYTTLQDKKGAQSPIIYFRTLPGREYFLILELITLVYDIF